MTEDETRRFLRDLFDVAVAAASPALVVPRHLPAPPRGRTIVLGAGKASAEMAKAVEDHWPGALEGLVVTRYGHGAPCTQIEIVEASHPVPDAKGEEAARRILALAETARADDLVLCLISGGGSALLALPAPGLTLADKQAVNRALLASGAAIGEMNVVRKHLSAIKGGRLAAAAFPARTLTLLISDVPGDDPAIIASGPTVADPSTFADARAIVARYGIDLPAGVAARLAGDDDETPKPGDPRLANARAEIIASPKESLAAAASAARQRGIDVELLGDAIEGEARDIGRAHGELALAARRAGKRTLLLSGGETTVTIKAKGGRGGRNGEYLAGLALALGGEPGILALAADTDGIDGSENNAGAMVTPDTLARAAAQGIDFAAALSRNDMYGVYAALGDLVVSGPTRTNVNDFRAILVA